MTWSEPRRRVETDKGGAIHPDSGHMLTLLQSLVDKRGTISLQQWCPSGPEGLECYYHVGIVVHMVIYRLTIKCHKENCIFCCSLW